MDATDNIDYTYEKVEVYSMVRFRLLGIIFIIITLAFIAFVIYFLSLVVRALRKYINSADVRYEKAEIRKTLAELLKENRIRCKMTQEFVAETIGVSRQAVSKWENGSADPSTSNLIALANLYGISAENLLKKAAPKKDKASLSSVDEEEKEE